MKRGKEGSREVPVVEWVEMRERRNVSGNRKRRVEENGRGMSRRDIERVVGSEGDERRKGGVNHWLPPPPPPPLIMFTLEIKLERFRSREQNSPNWSGCSLSPSPSPPPLSTLS